MKKGLLLLSVILLVGGYYVLIYQPNHTTVAPAILPTQTPTQMIAETSIDETDAIIQAMKEAIVAKRGTGAATMKYPVSKIEGNFAQGGVSAEGGGAMWLAAKVNGIWTLIWDGNGVILCTDIASYPDLPTTMVPECYNETTKTSITR